MANKTKSNQFQNILFGILIGAALIYLALILFLYFGQRKILFAPDKIEIKQATAGFVENYLITEDGIRIYSWFHLADQNHGITAKIDSQANQISKNSKIRALVYFHGNAGSLLNRQERAQKFAEAGFSVLMVSYRGYANSQGEPSEAGFVFDGCAALNFLFSQGFKPEEILIYGESIGSSVAVQMAAKLPDLGMLVLEAPFTSVENVAKRQYWFVPVSLLLKDKFNSAARASEILAPILVFHAIGDPVVNFSEGEQLFTKFNSPKKFVKIEANFHIDLQPTFIIDQISSFNQQIQASAQYSPKNH